MIAMKLVEYDPKIIVIKSQSKVINSRMITLEKLYSPEDIVFSIGGIESEMEH